MTTATPTRPTPGIMPERRPERPAVQAATRSAGTTLMPQERTFTRNPGELTSTIGTILALRADRTVDELELLYRPACNEAYDRVQTYAEEVPEGKTKRRWQRVTAEKVSAQLEIWFDLPSEEGYRPNLLPNLLSVAQKIFVEVCVELGIVGASGQDTSWYREREPKVKVAPKAAKTTRSNALPQKKEKPAVKAAVAPAITVERDENLVRLCQDAIGHVQRYARKLITRNTKKSQRWSETTLDIAVTLLQAYFFESSHEEIEEKLSDSMIRNVRERFAYACIKNKVQRTPGQQAEWYNEVAAATRAFIQSRPARPSR